MDILLTDYFNDLYTSVYETVLNPRKRVFWGYILLAFFIGLFWLKWRSGRRLMQIGRELLSRRIWWSESAKADYKLLLINKAILLAILPLLITKMTLATIVFQQLYGWVGARPLPGSILPDWAVPVCFTLFLFLLDDFARYFLHRLMHRWPVLWAFHKVHHSARTMTPFTVLRTHPVEGLLFTLRSILVQSVSIGTFLFLFGDRVDLVTVLGVNVVVFAFNVTGSNLRHSHVPIYYWRGLERILISPAQHQIHHSTLPRHFDKNFGAILATWDWIGGSLHHSEPQTELKFGVSSKVEPDEQRLKTLYLGPFREAWRAVIRLIRRPTEPESLTSAGDAVNAARDS